MNPQDLDQLNRLILRQKRLEDDMSRLRSDIGDLEYRVKTRVAPDPFATLPPLPKKQIPQPVQDVFMVQPNLSDHRHQSQPPIPPIQVPPTTNPTPHFPPIPTLRAESSTPDESASTSGPLPPPPSTTAPDAPSESFELQFGRWLARIGVVFALITLISFSTLAYKDFYRYMGPWSKDAVLAIISVALTWGGLRLERTNPKMMVFGRTLAAGGLGCLYYTLYGATYLAPLQIISSPVLGGILLLAWSAYVLYLAETKKSELLSLFAIALAYFSSSITPEGVFTLVANLILSATALVFLVRNSWTYLSYLCLVGTYVGFLRQIVTLNWDTLQYTFNNNIPFVPSAVYLGGAWLIYTAAVFLAKTPQFESGKRLAFLCLNNGGFIGLLLLAANVTAFGHLGAILICVGLSWIAAGYLIKSLRSDAGDVARAYIVQGLGVGTGGLVIAYNGVTRGLLLTLESLFLAASGAFSRNVIFRAGGFLTGLLATGYLIAEILPSKSPWVLMVAGASAMLINALLARRDLWSESCEVAERKVSLGAGYYIVLAFMILWCGMGTQFIPSTAVAILAGVVVVLSFSVYLVPLYELPFLSQLLLNLVQIAAIPPDQQHPALPTWVQGALILVSLIMSGWWSFQKVVWAAVARESALILNALLVIPLFCLLIHPHVTEQVWMISAGGLSIGFLLYGLLIRTWTFPVAGQFFLLLSLTYFFFGTDGVFRWDVSAAAAVIVTVWLTYTLVGEWLKRTTALAPGSEMRTGLEYTVAAYSGLTVIMIIRSILGLVPDHQMVVYFFAIGTAYLVWNLVRPNPAAIRWVLVFDFFGILAYLSHWDNPGTATLHALGLTCFLAQPFILKAFTNSLLSEAERWALVIGSVGMGWIFVSNQISLANSQSLALGWVIYALAIIILGFVASERKHRWFGLIILVAAIGRAGLFDFWTLSDLYKVLTFFVLSVTCLGLSYVYYRYADRIKAWL